MMQTNAVLAQKKNKMSEDWIYRERPKTNTYVQLGSMTSKERNSNNL